jgi:CDP-4-dehydro-6-deoxyglucose reductase, E1
MIKLVKSTFYKERETKQRLSRFLLAAKQLSFGKECKKFEKQFASWQGRKHCILLNSGSSANLALIQALLNLDKIHKGDMVGFSAVTWSTNVMPLIQLGLKPIPVDVELDTLNVSRRTLLHTLDKHKLKALLLTNLLGFCDDIDKVAALCNERGILLAEDNCESLGSVYNAKKLGNFGIASTFSFYVGHHMSTVEGGAVCTDDNELANMLIMVRAHGWDRNLSVREQHARRKLLVNRSFYGRYTFYNLGYNFRPTEIIGYLGQIQLTFLPEIIKKRQNNFKKLAKKIYRSPDYYPVRYDHMGTISNFAVPIICKSTAIRDALVKACANKIEIRPIVGGDMTEQPFFTKYVKDIIPECVNAKLVHDQGLYFGNNPELTRGDLHRIDTVFSHI